MNDQHSYGNGHSFNMMGSLQGADDLNEQEMRNSEEEPEEENEDGEEEGSDDYSGNGEEGSNY